MNSGATGIAFRTLVRHGDEITEALMAVPSDVPLAEAPPAVLDSVTELVVVTTRAGREEAVRRAARLDPLANGIGVSVATKLLHKKRPALVSILDNEAIFRDYLGQTPPDAGEVARGPVRTALTSILGTVIALRFSPAPQRGGKPKRRLRPPHHGMGMSSSGKPASMSTGV
jgi:hypothetical protein